MLFAPNDIYRTCKQRIVISAYFIKLVTPVSKYLHSSVAVSLKNLQRPLANRLFNDFVRKLILHAVGNGNPIITRQLIRKTTCLTQRIQRQPFQVTVTGTEVLVLVKEIQLSDSGYDAIHPHEGHVSVARNRFVYLSFFIFRFKACPSPLVGMPVPIRNQHVKQACTGKSILVNPVIDIGIYLQMHLSAAQHVL